VNDRMCEIPPHPQHDLRTRRMLFFAFALLGCADGDLGLNPCGDGGDVRFKLGDDRREV
jgi:hypothetical protein